LAHSQTFLEEELRFIFSLAVHILFFSRSYSSNKPCKNSNDKIVESNLNINRAFDIFVGGTSRAIIFSSARRSDQPTVVVMFAGFIHYPYLLGVYSRY
jgi:hypothetical protein